MADSAHRNAPVVERLRRRLWELRATGTITEVETLADVANAARQMKDPEDLRDRGETPVRMTVQLFQAWLVETAQRKPVEAAEVADEFLYPMDRRSVENPPAGVAEEDPVKAFLDISPRLGEVARLLHANPGPISATLAVQLRRAGLEVRDEVDAFLNSLPLLRGTP